MNTLAVIAHRIGLAWCGLILALYAVNFPNNIEAFGIYMHARSALRLDNPQAALVAMRAAMELDPFNPDYRRNHIVAVTQLATKNEFVSAEDAARAFEISVSASGYDQNTLTVWIMWLVLAGRGDSEAYQTARTRLDFVNPNLAEPFEADVMVTAMRGDFAAAREAALKFQTRTRNEIMKSRAIELLEAIDNAARG